MFESKPYLKFWVRWFLCICSHWRLTNNFQFSVKCSLSQAVFNTARTLSETIKIPFLFSSYRAMVALLTAKSKVLQKKWHPTLWCFLNLYFLKKSQIFLSLFLFHFLYFYHYHWVSFQDHFPQNDPVQKLVSFHENYYEQEK